MNADDLVALSRRIPEVPGYVLTAFYAGRWGIRRFLSWRRRHRPPAPTSILDHRMKMRAQIEERMTDRLNQATWGEVIIRDLRRIDDFPRIDLHGVGPSAWFKIELNGFYHRGIEVFLSDAKRALPIGDEHGMFSGWRFLEEGEERDQGVTAWPVGRIPFDFIERIDWTPDEYEGLPHFYCRFDGSFFDPYEEIVYKGILYPSVSRTYHEIHGLRHPRHPREEWGLVRRWWFRSTHRLKSAGQRFTGSWRREG